MEGDEGYEEEKKLKAGRDFAEEDDELNEELLMEGLLDKVIDIAKVL